MPAEIYPNIYIGSIHAAFNQEALLERGITHVSLNGTVIFFVVNSFICQIINASRLPSTFPKTFTYLSIDVRDKYVAL